MVRPWRAVRSINLTDARQLEGASINGSKSAPAVLTCGHAVSLCLIPYPGTEQYAVPGEWPCSQCPEVPDARAWAYRDGQFIPQLEVVS